MLEDDERGDDKGDSAGIHERNRHGSAARQHVISRTDERFTSGPSLQYEFRRGFPTPADEAAF